MQREQRGSQHERHERKWQRGETQKMQQKWAVRAALGILVSIWGRWRFCHCGADGDKAA